MMPIAGRMSTYTSGCARNQKRCCHKSGLPPPATWSGSPDTTRPLGRKKLVPARRSISCITDAASSGGEGGGKREGGTKCAGTEKGRQEKGKPLPPGSPAG